MSSDSLPLDSHTLYKNVTMVNNVIVIPQGMPNRSIVTFVLRLFIPYDVL